MDFYIIFAFILDLIFGDPKFLYHPIIFIGSLISKTEKILLKLLKKDKNSQFFGGFILFLIVCSVSYALPYFILNILLIDFLVLKNTLCIFWACQIFATKSLYTESMKVYYSLKSCDILDARLKLSYIVGRDTKNLSDEKIIKATVETVAENLTDGIIAPLLFMIIGGVPLAFFYKAVNTLDSMVGYKNDKYLYFGRFSAKADDFLNFIPARIAAVFMIISAFLCGFNYKNSLKIFLRDRLNHKSPNAAQTESACAGALNIMLGGDSVYFGKIVKKQTIGDDIRPICIDDIKKSNKLMLFSSILCALIFGGIYGVF